MKKKILALFLAFMMLVSASPVALAEGPQAEPGEAAELTETEPELLPPAAEEATSTEEPAQPGDEAEPPAEETPAEAPAEEPAEETPSELPAEEPTDEPEEEPAEEPEEEEEAAALPVPGMPEGYELSPAELQEKQGLNDLNTLASLAALTEGVDYRAGEILYTADTQAYAEMVAAAYAAELLDCSYGVATAMLTTITVAEAVELAADLQNNLPAVSPNYIRYIEPGSLVDLSASNPLLNSAVPQKMDWTAWVTEVMSNPDAALKDPAAEKYQWHHDTINTYEAWGVTTGSSSVKVAVIDTGVATGNPDIHNVTTVNVGLGTADDNGHGTHVIGLINAAMNNGTFGAGVAPGVSVISIKAITADGQVDESAEVKAINAAVQNGAKLINMSLGGPIASITEQSAIRNAINKGVAVIAAMGNDGTNIANYPAAYDGVISVCASNRADQRATFSNYGAWADVTAPGVDIWSTVGTGYDTKNGTSMACPIVTGVAALYLSRYGSTSPATLKAKLKASSTNGVIDAGKLFAGETAAPTLRLVDEFGVSAVKNTITVDGKLLISFANGSTAEGDKLVYTTNGKNPAVLNGELVSGTTTSGTISFTYMTPGKYTIKAASVNGLGVMSKVASLTVQVLPSNHPTSLKIIAGESLIAGKSLDLRAVVSPTTASQQVSWSIQSRVGVPGATITSAGQLKTVAGQTGSVTVRAVSTADAGIAATVTIQIVAGVPVAGLTLNATSVLLNVYAGSSVSAHRYTLKPSFTDKNKAPIDAATVDYDFVSSNTAVATVTAAGRIQPVKAGTATITCRALDGSGKKATCKVTVQNGVLMAAVEGIDHILPGATASYKAIPYFSQGTAANPKGATYTWSLENAPAGVTISDKGAVKVLAEVPSGSSFTVKVRIGDGHNTVTATKKITIQPLATAVQIYDATGGVNSLHTAMGTLSNLTLYSERYPRTNLTSATLKVSTLSAAVNVEWSSNNTKVASVDAKTGKVTAHSPGTAKITVRALDAGKKSASVTVKVVTPASSLSVVSKGVSVDENFHLLGFGKSVANTAVLGDAYGKPTAAPLEWSVTAYTIHYDTGKYESMQWLVNSGLVTVDKAGKLTLKQQVFNTWVNMDPDDDLYFDVTAHTTDGTDLYGSITYIAQNLTTRIEIGDWVNYYGSTYWVPVTKTTLYRNTGMHGVDLYVKSNGWYRSATVSSSNPQVAGATIFFDEDGNQVLEIISGAKAGTAKITVTAADGSNKKATITVVVK